MEFSLPPTGKSGWNTEEKGYKLAIKPDCNDGTLPSPEIVARREEKGEWGDKIFRDLHLLSPAFSLLTGLSVFVTIAVEVENCGVCYRSNWRDRENKQNLQIVLIKTNIFAIICEKS